MSAGEYFDGSGDATNDFAAFPWATGAPAANFPLIDARRGECYLWSGQSLDILHGVMTRGFQRIHCASTAMTGYGALGRGSYFTDKFSKALLYAINLRNEYFGAAKGEDIRVLMLSRVLLGNYLSMDNASKKEREEQTLWRTTSS
jgi:Poly(ADP-ribose) polymerase catalytic domain